MRTLLALLCLATTCAHARAADFTLHGYGELRAVAAPQDDSYLDGGLGKFRFGEDDRNKPLQIGDVVAEGRAALTPVLLASATVRVNSSYGPAVDLLEASLAYNADVEGDWRWAVRAGAFFPPNSLENDQIGWTPLWTITPSAINSWVGSELRTIGVEGTVKWRRAGGDLTLSGALFGWNDPAGEMIAGRGWNFDDRVTGLFETTRLPNASALARHLPVPLETHLFAEVDSRPGYYLDLQYEPDTATGLELMRYDNLADPGARRGGHATWRTEFWNAGFQRQIGHLTVLAQAMSGSTEIAPGPSFRSTTDFRAAYVLAGWDFGDVLIAGRADLFQTRTLATRPSPNSEDGSAGTLAVTWLPSNWLRLTAELLSEDSQRDQRLITGDPAKARETQLQMLARVMF